MRISGKSFLGRENSRAIIQEMNESGLNQGSSSKGGEKWSVLNAF